MLTVLNTVAKTYKIRLDMLSRILRLDPEAVYQTPTLYTEIECMVIQSALSPMVFKNYVEQAYASGLIDPLTHEKLSYKCTLELSRQLLHLK